MNKKGLVQQLMIVLILFIVVIVGIGVYWIVSMFGPVVVGEGNALASQVQTSIHANNPGSALDNSSQIATITTTNILGVFELLVYIAMIGGIIGFIMIAWYVRTYPWLAAVWIFAIIFFAFFAMLISNSYQQAALSGPSEMQQFYADWGTNNFLMTYLPHMVIFFGILGGIILFVLVSRDSESEVMPI